MPPDLSQIWTCIPVQEGALELPRGLGIPAAGRGEWLGLAPETCRYQASHTACGAWPSRKKMNHKGPQSGPGTFGV